MSDEKYWCLFCGQDGKKFKTTEELFHHMRNTVHKDDTGNIIIFTGDKS